MSNCDELLQKYTAIYRSSDDITNLKIKIKLRQVESFESDDSNQWEEQTFQWQQKVFSKTEREFYRNEKNCITDLEKKYHQDVTKLATDHKFSLYSYVNEDEFALKEEINEILTKKDDDNESEYDYRKSVLSAAQNPLTCKYEFEVMFLMADFGEYVDTSWIKYEKTLCIIKYDKNHRILSIYPDFTHYRPYCMRIDGATSRKFQYFIENVSDEIPEEERYKETELIRKLNKQKLAILQENSNFVLPPKNKLEIYLFIDILWAKQFEYDQIYVQYFVDLPPDWTCRDKSQLQGITQTCHAKGEEMLAHFGHVFEVVLEYNIECLEQKHIPKSPYIYFEVISKDSWSRFRTEGLTYKNLPVAKPGNYRFELQCFRLVPDSISGELRRFFIGDCSNYSDITWIGPPKDYEGSFLNKYGTNTVGTGQIGVRINVIQQSQAFRDFDAERTNANLDIFEKLNSSSLVKSVEQVLQAFKRARKNMIAARKNL